MDNITPGPWEFRIVPGSKPPKVTVTTSSDKFNEHVALCYGGEHDALANARLLAAAPDLAAELEDLTAAVKGCAKSGTITGPGVDYLLRIISKYQALAKAEGA